jgi:hypothetical protein
MTVAPLTAAVARFLRYLGVERQLSPITLQNYQRQLDAIMQIAEETGLQSWQQCDAATVRGFAVRSRRKGLGPASLALRLSALRSFFDWMVSQGELTANPAKVLLGGVVINVFDLIVTGADCGGQLVGTAGFRRQLVKHLAQVVHQRGIGRFVGLRVTQSRVLAAAAREFPVSANTNYDPSRFPSGKVPMQQLLKDLLTAYNFGVKTLYYQNTRDGAEDAQDDLAPSIQDDGCESGACKI